MSHRTKGPLLPFGLDFLRVTVCHVPSLSIDISPCIWFANLEIVSVPEALVCESVEGSRVAALGVLLPPTSEAHNTLGSRGGGTGEFTSVRSTV